MELPLSITLAAAYYSALSLLCAALFAFDKHAAQTRSRRIPEATLHTVELLGGWLGALLAMRVLRHKSAKPRYRVITVLIALGHVAVWVILLFAT